MIVPFAHLDELQKLPEEAAHEMMDLAQRMERILRQLYTPGRHQSGDEYRQGCRRGRGWTRPYACPPRWVADANFMTVVGETRILPETLETTYERIKGAMQG